jgi:formate dehydrogenase subunit gamma
MTTPEPAAAASSSAIVLDIVARWKDEPGALLPILHDVQHALGHIPAQCVAAIADGLNLSRAEVHGVITYYPHFHSKPTGRHVLQVCQAEACQAMGAQALMAHAKARLGCNPHEQTADGLFTLEPVYCLGMCASSPAVMIDGKVHARITPERFDRLVARLEAAV